MFVIIYGLLSVKHLRPIRINLLLLLLLLLAVFCGCNILRRFAIPHHHPHPYQLFRFYLKKRIETPF
uniref:Putative secreted protein n=1 Tax=Anopheles darlingi TaxID=43151 RepID=A0A2M4DJJ1_ANODA